MATSTIHHATDPSIFKTTSSFGGATEQDRARTGAVAVWSSASASRCSSRARSVTTSLTEANVTCKRCLKKIADAANPAPAKTTTTKKVAQANVATAEELDARLAELPAFSREVYDLIQNGLYAEPGFTDVARSTKSCTASDVSASA